MDSSSNTSDHDHPVLVFDGTCVLCNFFFQWMLKKDKRKLFRFSTLQSDSGQRLLKNHHIDLSEDTVLLSYNGELMTFSSAALQTMILLGGLPKWFGYLGFIFPKFFRDLVYRFIAKNRYKWFGNKECLIPGPDVKDRFI